MKKIMKHVNVVTVSLAIGSLIGASVLILSYLHTAGLFERSGYTGVFAHIGVVGFELVFILGTGVSIWSKWQGVKVATSTKFALGLGVCINLYSNITSGIAKDGRPLVFFSVKGIPIDEAVLIGGLIPILFVVAEMVISDAISKSRDNKLSNVAEDDPINIEPAQVKHEDTEPEPEAPTPDTHPIQEPPQPIEPIPLQDEPDKSDTLTVKPNLSLVPTVTKSLTPVTEIKRKVSDDELKKVAERIKTDIGKYPSVRDLKEKANSKYQAEKVLKELRSNEPSQPEKAKSAT
jgi:hypothetical protein